MNSDNASAPAVTATTSSGVLELDPIGAMLRRKTDRPPYGELRQRPAEIIRVAVIGYGYWGPNVVRNFQSVDSCQMMVVCDKNPNALRRASRLYPGLALTT